MKRLYFFSVLVLAFLSSFSQTDPPSPIVFIYDASGSMWGQMQGKTKMEIASEVLSKSIEELPNNQKIGLVAYGHRKKGDCKDVETLVGMDNSDKSAISSAINAIKPLGKTPLAFSANIVIEKMRASKERATIVLITDGIESCDGDLCKVVSDAKKEGIDFKLHIVGFGLKENETDNLRCAAEAGGGHYFDADDAIAFNDAIEEATSQTVDLPDGNISVFAAKNGIPIDAYVNAYDLDGNKLPAAGRTYRDTAFIYLAPGTYDLKVRPLEGSDVDAITITGIQSAEDKIVHRNVSFDAGKLNVMATNNGEGWDATIKIYDLEGRNVAVERTYGRSKEIEVNPGTYKIVYQALKIKGSNTSHEAENIVVTANTVTENTHEFKSVTLFIDAKVDGKSIDTVVKIMDSKNGKNVDGGRTYTKGKEFILNPETYQVNIKPLGNYKNLKAQTLTLELKAGDSISKEVNF